MMVARSPRIVQVGAVVVALAFALTTATAAMAADGSGGAARADGQTAHSIPTANEIRDAAALSGSTPSTTSSASSSGIDWADAALGAGIVMALAALSGVAYSRMRSTHKRPALG